MHYPNFLQCPHEQGGQHRPPHEGAHALLGSQTIRYGDVNFDQGFMSAIDANGRQIRFTRAESELLRQLAARPDTLLSRDRLLDAMDDFGLDTNDRYIDFLVNRIRRKLKDTPRKPRFIATRYGEGYIWVAKKGVPARSSQNAFIVVGPLKGIDEDAPLALEFVDQLIDTLSKVLDDDQKVVLDATCPAPTALDSGMPRFQIEPCFVPLGEQLNCALTLKHFQTGSVIWVGRVSVGALRADAKVNPDTISDAAASCLNGIWQHIGMKDVSMPLPESPPIPVRLYNAGRAVTRKGTEWEENEIRLRKQIAANPGDAEAKLLLATAIHAKYIRHGVEIFCLDDPRQEDESEIEALTTSALPELQSNGMHVLTAAKLLYFINPVYRPMALELADAAYRSTPAFASALTVYGQLRMWEGHLEEANKLYEKALALNENDTDFRRYLLTLMTQGLVAAGTPEAAAPLMLELCQPSQAIRRFFLIFFDPGADPDLKSEANIVLSGMPRSLASAALIYFHYASVRLFRNAQHRRNLLDYITNRLIGRFGEDIVPAEVKMDVRWS